MSQTTLYQTLLDEAEKFGIRALRDVHRMEAEAGELDSQLAQLQQKIAFSRQFHLRADEYRRILDRDGPCPRCRIQAGEKHPIKPISSDDSDEDCFRCIECGHTVSYQP